MEPSGPVPLLSGMRNIDLRTDRGSQCNEHECAMSLNLLPGAVPEHVALVHPDGIALRRARTADAEALARAVRESRDHLLPWMPWAANDDSCDPTFQATRLRDGEASWRRGDEFNYLIVDSAAQRVLGACGLMTRRGPRTLEIGYWSHVASAGRGHARTAAAALTAIARRVPGVDEVFIICDAANKRSAAIPHALGYVLRGIAPRLITAPGEAGQEMTWVMAGGG